MFWWILGGGLLMSAIALIGVVTLVVSERRMESLLTPLVALAAGSLIGGALFHMVPAAVGAMGNTLAVYAWIAGGFVTFFALEQYLQWHHCHRAPGRHRRPITYLILIADGLHNLLGGLAVAGSFLIDVRVGVMAWIAAAAHEIPQELGDYGVLVHGGWRRRSALLFNFFSALTFPIGGIIVYSISDRIDVAFLLPFAAGNFLYIGASDLLPEVRGDEVHGPSASSLIAFLAGLGALLLVGVLFG